MKRPHRSERVPMEGKPEANAKQRVTVERDKLRQTTHWDMDYLPLETVEDLYGREQLRTADAPSPEPPPRTTSNRRLGVICILAGMVVLILTLALASLLAD